MLVQCLGSGDAFGSGGKLNTCFYVKTSPSAQGLQILLDCGVSSSIAMKRAGLTVNDVNVIVISHFHGDHFGGLPVFIREAQSVRDHQKVLTIIGPDGIKQKTEEALQCLYPGPSAQDSFPIQFLTYSKHQPLTFGALQLTAYRALHSADTNPHILRLEAGGKIIAFSGDTEWTDDLLAASNRADLFICEASFYTAGHKNHMSVAELLDKLDHITAKKIVLTHAGEKVLKHAAAIPLPIAEDGQVLLDK